MSVASNSPTTWSVVLLLRLADLTRAIPRKHRWQFSLFHDALSLLNLQERARGTPEKSLKSC